MSIETTAGAAIVRRVRPAPEAPAQPSVAMGPMLLAVAAFAAVLLSHLLDFGFEHLRLSFFDANTDVSWSHLLTDALLVVAFLISAAECFRARPSLRTAWRLVACALLLLAVDELSPLHGSVDQLSWGKLIYVPVLVALCAGLWRLSSHIDSGALLRAGLIMLVVSYAIHVLGPHVVRSLGWSSSGWAYQVKVGLKQGTELAGWVLVAAGLSLTAMRGLSASRRARGISEFRR